MIEDDTLYTSTKKKISTFRYQEISNIYTTYLVPLVEPNIFRDIHFEKHSFFLLSDFTIFLFFQQLVYKKKNATLKSESLLLSYLYRFPKTSILILVYRAFSIELAAKISRVLSSIGSSTCINTINKPGAGAFYVLLSTRSKTYFKSITKNPHFYLFIKHDQSLFFVPYMYIQYIQT